MKIVSVIPARYAATRFPAKLMQDLEGKTVILRTYQSVVSTQLFDQVLVATDSPIIYNEIITNGGNAMMSTKKHECGSDRIAEAVEKIDTDIIVNVQGDEPFIDKSSLEKLIQVFKADKNKGIDLASLMVKITDRQEIESPDTVKVIVDNKQFAMYFSRLPIPFQRTPQEPSVYHKHLGVYAFRKQALLDFHHLSMLPLEASEKIEAIRFLEYGKKIKMVETHAQGIQIDTPEDLKRARNYFQSETQ